MRISALPACLLIAAALCFSCVVVCAAADMEITPFTARNQSPLIRIFGLPSETSAALSPPGSTALTVTQDVASNYTVAVTPREHIVLDGESYRWSLAVRHGFGGRYEAGIELPLMLQGGGFLDGFIVDWHKAFGLPQGGRDTAPKNRIGYRYTRDGVEKLAMTSSGSGIGDVSLTGGMQLHESLDGGEHDSLALRMQLKMPTGDSSALFGSGSTDLSLLLCGSMNRQTEWGTLGVYGSAGGMAMTRGRVLPDQQNKLAGVGTFGMGWGPSTWISFKLQLNGHSPLYRNSSLDELSRSSLMLIIGGALRFSGGYQLDIGVTEDVVVATSPDVAFHLGLSRRF